MGLKTRRGDLEGPEVLELKCFIQSKECWLNLTRHVGHVVLEHHICKNTHTHPFHDSKHNPSLWWEGCGRSNCGMRVWGQCGRWDVIRFGCGICMSRMSIPTSGHTPCDHIRPKNTCCHSKQPPPPRSITATTSHTSYNTTTTKQHKPLIMSPNPPRLPLPHSNGPPLPPRPPKTKIQKQ